MDEQEKGARFIKKVGAQCFRSSWDSRDGREQREMAQAWTSSSGSRQVKEELYSDNTAATYMGHVTYIMFHLLEKNSTPQ